MTDKIAIIGLGCLLPGAHDPEAFFNLLMEKRAVTVPLNARELGADPQFYFHPRPGMPDKIGYHTQGLIRDFRFDSHGYKLDPPLLETLDRICQWPIYAAGQAIKDSGYWNRSTELADCGIIMGNLTFPTRSSKTIFSRLHHQALEPYLQTLLRRTDFHLAEPFPVNPSDVNAMTIGLPARITAQALGLCGPCYEIDAACATSIYVIQLASWHLLSGHADMMLAGAVCCPDYLYVAHGFQILRALPPADGRSIPFDLSSQGMKIGEGAGFLVLKRYRDALRDGDRIHAVVESIGLSNDGKGKHILVPSKMGQILALERAYRNMEKGVDYIECHATGTPLGDKTELASLEQFFGGVPSLPLLGGNKANIGHTLTVAAMASILKVVMGMNRGIVPATIGVENAISSPNGTLTGEHIVRDNRAWPQQGTQKKAGINAFGFGGIDAHIVLTTPPAKAARSRKTSVKRPSAAFEKIAIVGMHGHWGNLDRLDALNEMIHDGRQNLFPPGSERWIGGERNIALMKKYGLPDGTAPHGSYCDIFDLDCRRFKVPPREADAQLFSHLLMLDVADRALEDAGFSMTGEGRNVAVVVATKTDWLNHRSLTRVELPWHLQRKLRQYGIELSAEQQIFLESLIKDAISPEPSLEKATGEIGNLAASRIASVWNLTGPSLVVSSVENSAYRGLQLARLLLSLDPEIEAVLLGAVDLSGSLEHVLWRAGRLRNRQGIASNPAASGLNIGEGAGALVLKRERDCSAERIYARIRALQILQQASSDRLETAPKPEYVSRVCTDALHEAGVSPAQIGYIEAHSGGIELEEKAERAGLAQAYLRQAGHPDQVIGSVKANIGDTFAASGIAALIKAALCLYHRYLPGIPGKWESKYRPFAQDGFKAIGQSRFWPGSARMAGVNGLGMDGSYVHVLLEEPTEEQRKVDRTSGVSVNPADSRKFVKRLSSGWKPLEEFILQEEHQRHFPPPPDSAAKTTMRLNARPDAKPDTVHQLIENAVRRNAETQLIYSRIKNAFQEKMISSLSEGSVEWAAFEVGRAGEKRRSPGMQEQKAELIWDESQIIEMADGQLSSVLGPEYSEVDRYPVRARVPLPPFLFVSRVTRMNAEQGQLKPCSMEWEYDIPRDAWYIANGMVPGFLAFESCHAIILMLSYIGCDRLSEGLWRYRAVDSQVSFLGSPPLPGETLTGKATIHTFRKNRRNLLFFYDYHCFAGSREIFQIRASAGFFSPQDMNNARGIAAGERDDPEEKYFRELSPLAHCSKESFDEHDLEALRRGEFGFCFGAGYASQPPNLLGAPPLKMLDRVVSVNRSGGRWRLGEIIGEKDITPDHWAFAAHFKNDPVMPGTMLLEGCSQLLLFYMFYLGLHTRFDPLRVDCLKGTDSVIKFRGEVKPEPTTIRFRLQIQQISVIPETHAVGRAEIIHRDSIIGICDHLGVRFHGCIRNE